MYHNHQHVLTILLCMICRCCCRFRVANHSSIRKHGELLLNWGTFGGFAWMDLPFWGFGKFS